MLKRNNLEIGKLKLEDVEGIVHSRLPNIGFELTYCDGTLVVPKLEEILKYISKNKIIPDGLKLLSSDSSMPRKSVGYEIAYLHGLEEEITFEMVDSQHIGPSPNGILGHIFTYSLKGNEVRQLTLSNIWLR